MEIVLSSKEYMVSRVFRKSKAKMFENLHVGSQIRFAVPLKSAGRNRGTYATYITIENIKTGEETTSSFNQLPKILEAFELE